ncbi:MAG: hypothetical protein PHE59_04795 [Patescibacteria group bacterium]|nr:hypothetical protein [Patescibacteria group bacterium]
MEKEKVRVFVGNGCAPCGPVKELIRQGRVETDIDAEIEVIDVTTDEGFELIEKEDLDRVPQAKYAGRFCLLEVDHESRTVLIKCQ